MNRNYERIILNKLIKKYERSKISTESTKRNIKISIKLDKNTLPEYINEDSYKYETDIHNTVKILQEKNFIECDFKNNRINKITLNLDNIERIYEYLQVDSPQHIKKTYLSLLQKYKNQGQLVQLFIEKAEKLIMNNEPHQKLFKNKKELEEILIVLENLVTQKVEISRRVFSSKYLNDSKRLEIIQSKIENIIRDITNNEQEDILSNYNVYKNPTYIYIKGSGIFKINDQIIDLDKLKSELIISSNQIENLNIVTLNVNNIVTVENLTTFYDYRINNNLIIYLGGFHNEIRRNFLCKLDDYSKKFKFYHCGDIDAGGFYILNHLIEKTKINLI